MSPNIPILTNGKPKILPMVCVFSLVPKWTRAELIINVEKHTSPQNNPNNLEDAWSLESPPI